MINMLKNWKGAVEINGTKFNSIQDAMSFDFSNVTNISIKLTHDTEKRNTERPATSDIVSETVYRVKVKQYMTKKATPAFDFMSKFNNDIPMPLRVMVGTKEKETRGMVYMKLHGDIVAEQMQFCMKCGKPITNPVSQYFGMGPECGNHNYVNPFNSKEELKSAIAEYRKQLQTITWEGWVIKSAIEEEEIYD